MRVLGSSGSWRFWPRRHGHPSRQDRKSAGYNLVVLAVTITVMNILVAKALPMWSHQIQREKEAELIFRGLQYAEAIRLFEVNNGRLPTKLEELIADGQRRFIRQLWTNPMSDDGEWGLIFQDAPVNQQGRSQGRGQGRNDGRGRRGDDGSENTFGLPRAGEEVRVGPIIGVYSREGSEAIKVFSPVGGGGGRDVSQWRFTKDLLQGLGSRGVGAGDGAFARADDSVGAGAAFYFRFILFRST